MGKWNDEKVSLLPAHDADVAVGSVPAQRLVGTVGAAVGHHGVHRVSTRVRRRRRALQAAKQSPAKRSASQSNSHVSHGLGESVQSPNLRRFERRNRSSLSSVVIRSGMS